MFVHPEKIVETAKITLGMHVADLGAGTGHVSIPASRAVAQTGAVYAVDLQKNLLDSMANKATSEGLKNVHMIWGDIEAPNGTTLKSESIDAVLVVNTLFQAHDKHAFLAEASRILKPGKPLVLVDWSESFSGMGPHKDHVFSEKEARAELQSSGFDRIESVEAGAHHYGLMAYKS